MGTLLLAVTLYGLLFSLLQATGAHWVVYLVVSGYLALIALAQMLLFGGKKPRLASFVAGGMLAGVFLLLSAFQKRKPDAADDSPFAIPDDDRTDDDVQ
jgi:hypothetical protein